MSKVEKDDVPSPTKRADSVTAAGPDEPAFKPASSRAEPAQTLLALADTWDDWFRKAGQIDCKPCEMRDAFEEKTAIMRDMFGWGIIPAKGNDRLKVLFKDGVKYLTSNLDVVLGNKEA